MTDQIDPTTIYYVWNGQRLYLPYPGAFGTGSKDAAEHQVIPNRHNGYAVVAMEVEVNISQCPHDWGHYKYLGLKWGTQYKCRICEELLDA